MVIVVWYNEKKKTISNYKSGKKEQVLVKTMVQVNKILFVMKKILFVMKTVPMMTEVMIPTSNDSHRISDSNLNNKENKNVLYCIIKLPINS